MRRGCGQRTPSCGSQIPQTLEDSARRDRESCGGGGGVRGGGGGEGEGGGGGQG